MIGYGARQHIRKNAGAHHLVGDQRVTRRQGSFTLEETLTELVKNGLVDRKDALARAVVPMNGAPPRMSLSIDHTTIERVIDHRAARPQDSRARGEHGRFWPRRRADRREIRTASARRIVQDPRRVRASAQRVVPAAGVVAASGGNHGAAVAFAAMRLKVPAKIFVPTISSPARIDASDRPARI